MKLNGFFCRRCATNWEAVHSSRAVELVPANYRDRDQSVGWGSQKLQVAAKQKQQSVAAAAAERFSDVKPQQGPNKHFARVSCVSLRFVCLPLKSLSPRVHTCARFLLRCLANKSAGPASLSLFFCASFAAGAHEVWGPATTLRCTWEEPPVSQNVFPFRCDFDGKHLKPRDSLVSHIPIEGEVDHSVFGSERERERKEAKTRVGHEQEERMTHRHFHTRFFPHPPFSPTEGFPPQILSVRARARVRPKPGSKVAQGGRVGGESSSHLAGCSLATRYGANPGSEWKCQRKTGPSSSGGTVTFARCSAATRKNSFRLLWNWSLVKESRLSLSHSQPRLFVML